jgi:hypothetical protein
MPFANEEDRRDYKLWYRYGIDADDYEDMLEDQGFACAVCGSPNPKSRDGFFHVDHCHHSNAVRGLLCFPCNIMLGAAFDRPETLRAAAHYVEKSWTP